MRGGQVVRGGVGRGAGRGGGGGPAGLGPGGGRLSEGSTDTNRLIDTYTHSDTETANHLCQ